jgi:hypothetical protein
MERSRDGDYEELKSLSNGRPADSLSSWLELACSALGVSFLLSGCATPLQAELDAEVRRLCAIDGGVTVYERIMLPPERFDQRGLVHIPEKKRARPADDYFYELNYHYYRKSPYNDPALWRTEHLIIRSVDGKVLAKSIRYTRRGADMPGLGHPSTFSCPPWPKEDPNLESSVFVKRGLQ